MPLSHEIVEHCTALYSTLVYFTALHSTAMHCSDQNCTALLFTALHLTALNWTAVQCTALQLNGETYILHGVKMNFSLHSLVNLAKQSESLQWEFLWESTDLHRPSSTGQCSPTALGANTSFIALVKWDNSFVCAIVHYRALSGGYANYVYTFIFFPSSYKQQISLKGWN